jgi:hypothetical protein
MSKKPSASQGGLVRWHKEVWKDSKGKECGHGDDDSYCRPSKRVTKDTPKTWGEMSDKEKESAKKAKADARSKGKQYTSKKFTKIKNKVK